MGATLWGAGLPAQWRAFRKLRSRWEEMGFVRVECCHRGLERVRVDGKRRVRNDGGRRGCSLRDGCTEQRTQPRFFNARGFHISTQLVEGVLSRGELRGRRLVEGIAGGQVVGRGWQEASRGDLSVANAVRLIRVQVVVGDW